MRNFIKIQLLAMVASCWAAPAWSLTTDARIDGAKQCTRNLARYERQYGIPAHLLSAISSTESGRYHEGLRLALPWPWTINVEGKGYFYDSKEEAVAAVRKFQSQGARSIDIGCMQVNLIHHPDAFANLNEAFDPEANVAYAASFLRSLYEENKSWRRASANYHSRTTERGQQYVSKVYDHWTTIISRLRAAKADIPESAMAALEGHELPAKPVELKMAKADAPEPSLSPSPKTIHVKPKVTKSKTRMNEISIRTVADRSSDSHDNGVLIIRPHISVVDEPEVEMQMASVSHVEAGVTLPNAPKVIAVDDARKVQVASGPRFIFDN